MFKHLARLLPSSLLRRFMTPAGLAIEELIDEKGWTVDSHTFDHKESGISLWIATGYSFFGLYTLRKQNLHYDRDSLRKTLNAADLCVLWRAYNHKITSFGKFKEEEKQLVITNLARLALMKGETNE